MIAFSYVSRLLYQSESCIQTSVKSAENSDARSSKYIININYDNYDNYDNYK